MTAVKEAFLARDALAVVVALVAEPLQRHTAGRQSMADANTVQLVLTFLRNLLVLPDSSPAPCAPPCPPEQLCAVLLCGAPVLTVPIICIPCKCRQLSAVKGPPATGWLGSATTCHQLFLLQTRFLSWAALLLALHKERVCEARTRRSQARAATTGAGCGASCWSACWMTARSSCWPSWRSTPRGCAGSAGAPLLKSAHVKADARECFSALEACRPVCWKGSDVLQHTFREPWLAGYNALQPRTGIKGAVSASSDPVLACHEAPCVPQPLSRAPAGGQAPLKEQAPLLLEVYDAIFAGLDPAALLDAQPPGATCAPALEQRADRALHGGSKEVKAELDKQERAFQALRHVRPEQALSCQHSTDAALCRSGAGSRCLDAQTHTRDADEPIKLPLM